jgi:hypothetical protein
VRFLMQYRTLVQLACQTHIAQPSEIYAVHVPSLKVLSWCVVEFQPSPLMLAILLRAAFCFGLQRTSQISNTSPVGASVGNALSLRARSRSTSLKAIHNSKLKYMIYGISGRPAIRILKSRRLFPDGPITMAAPRLERKE